MKVYNVLITSVGGSTGVYLSKHLRQYEEFRVVGVDMSDLVAARCWLSQFYTVPASSDKAYFRRIEEIVEKEKIDVIIPVTSYDVDAFCTEIKTNDKIANKTLIMDEEMHMTLHNKETCYSYLKDIGLTTPKVLENVFEFPVVLKAKIDTGSKKTFVINNQDEYEYLRDKVGSGLLVEYLPGKEYTVDCLFDRNGTCLGYNTRERRKMNGGGAVISTNRNVDGVENVVNHLEKIGRIKGPVNFQFKLLENGDVCVFDFNTRFASGGIPLTVKSGFDIPKLLIDLILGKNVEKYKSNLSIEGLTMIRYYEEVFTNDR